MRIPIPRFGIGRWTSVGSGRAPLGSAKDAVNILFNRGPANVVLRDPVDRVWHTRPSASATLAAYEYVNSSGTRTLLAKHLANLYTFSLTPGSLTSILSGMASGWIPSMCTANGYAFVCDSGASYAGSNYISGGTSGTSYVLQAAAPTASLLTCANSAGTAVGNLASTIYFAYTKVTPEGVETPPSAATAVSRLADGGLSFTNNSLVFTAPYTTINVYVTTAGSSQMYRLATGITAANFAANLSPNNTLDTALTTASTVHLDDSTAAGIEKPAAAKFCAFHKGRLFLANFSGLRSRLRWSQEGLPTQFGSTSDDYLDVGQLDGGEITGLVSFRGSLVIFKTTSIWVMNGDADPTNFVLFEAVPGKGCPAPHTIVADGDTRILFLSQCGVLSFDLATVPQVPLSDPIAADLETLDWVNRANSFVAGLDLCTREYLLSVTLTGGSTNTKTHTYSLDTGAWGRREWCMGKVTPSCYSNTGTLGPIHTTTDQIALYFGDDAGYLYQFGAGTTGDGVASGTTTGTVTASGATTTTCGAAAFRTTGDGLTGLSMTLYRAADLSYESVTISSNTGTVITHGGWSGTAPVALDTVYVGAWEAKLVLNRMDLGTTQRKRFKRIETAFEKATHSISLFVGYVLEDGSTPTASTAYPTNTGFRCRTKIDRSGHGVSVYYDQIGVGHTLELLGIAVDVEVYTSLGATS